MKERETMIERIKKEIIEDTENKKYTDKDIMPLFVADKESRILIVGQAPGVKAQESMTAFNDKSGEKLLEWLGISEKEFRNPENFAILPMDFYYPGKGKSGDNKPRKDFAKKWHPLFLKEMDKIELVLLVGKYAIDFYLKEEKEKNLTETVRNYKNYLPKYFPLVHPSPLNFRWHKKNPCFEEEVVPELREVVAGILRKENR